MAYTPASVQAGVQPIATTSTTQNHPLGTVIRADDPTYGSGEFIYLLGVASTVVGSVVTYGGVSSSTPTWQTALAPATAGLAQPVAVAMSANVASQYGWYQIAGNAVCATNGTLAAGPAPIYLAGSGQVTSTQANGKQVLGAINVSATGTPSTGLAIVEISWPFAQGQVV